MASWLRSTALVDTMDRMDTLFRAQKKKKILSDLEIFSSLPPKNERRDTIVLRAIVSKGRKEEEGLERMN